MRIAFTFRNLESSDMLKTYANEKIQKLQKYLRAPLDAEVTISLERHLHRVEVRLNADGHRYQGHEESEDMYASIDLVMDKIDRQVREEIAKHKTRKRSSPKMAGIVAQEEEAMRAAAEKDL
ncbi:MAG: ribosome-associated translation inhibitor RaiA [Myxococcota bacterium]